MKYKTVFLCIELLGFKIANVEQFGSVERLPLELFDDQHRIAEVLSL